MPSTRPIDHAIFSLWWKQTGEIAMADAHKTAKELWFQNRNANPAEVKKWAQSISSDTEFVMAVQRAYASLRADSAQF